ncbi:MAG: protein kinase domain-containing protein, partial [Rhabdochlamydiaceae bacterium]
NSYLFIRNGITMVDSHFHKQPTLNETKIFESPPALPEKIGPYKIESLLSRGGMSLLYLGIHPQTRALIVVKVLSPEFVKNPEMVAQFLRESKIISLTNHPNIVKLYGEGEWEGGLYIVMEFIRGVSLRQFIEQHSLSMKKSIDILMQVAYALAHLHSHSVIHGDLKPENILMTEDGEVKVIDFGIARLHEEVKKNKGKSSKIIGTPTYMSPEQKEDPSSISFASDIYALGIIAYELFIGKLSFGVIHLSQVPKGLRLILEKALAVSIEERYSNVLQLISDLSNYLKSGGLEKDRPGTDQIKEILESIQKADLALSPSTILTTLHYEGAMARLKVLGQTNPYFDSFKFPDGSYGFIFAEPFINGFETSIYLGNLRGMIRAIASISEKFMFLPFLISLQRLIQLDPLNQKYALAFLILSPSRDELQFLSCGMGSIFHISPGSPKARRLQNHNPPLGTDNRNEWDIVIDNWNIGDILVAYTFPSTSDALIQETLENISLQSPQSQADNLIKKTIHFLAEKKPHILLSLHRIG